MQQKAQSKSIVRALKSYRRKARLLSLLKKRIKVWISKSQKKKNKLFSHNKVLKNHNKSLKKKQMFLQSFNRHRLYLNKKANWSTKAKKKELGWLLCISLSSSDSFHSLNHSTLIQSNLLECHYFHKQKLENTLVLTIQKRVKYAKLTSRHLSLKIIRLMIWWE